MKANKTLLYFTIVFWIITLQNTIAQSSYVFRHLTTNEGLSNASVKAIQIRFMEGFPLFGEKGRLLLVAGQYFCNSQEQKYMP